MALAFGLFWLTSDNKKRANDGAFFVVFDSLQQQKNKRQNNAINALLYPYQYIPITQHINALKTRYIAL